MKLIRKIGLAILACGLTLGLGVSVSAKEVPTPAYTHIHGLHAKIVLDAPVHKVVCAGDVIAKESDAPVEVVVQLQQEVDGAWKTLKVWSATGTEIANVGGNYTVPPGYNYRAKVTGYVYNNDGIVIEKANGYDQITFS